MFCRTHKYTAILCADMRLATTIEYTFIMNNKGAVLLRTEGVTPLHDVVKEAAVRAVRKSS